jgi:dephospho-CoA kinase
MFRVGLTGGVACGKTTVADIFASLGAGVVDTDSIARDVVEPGSAALAEIAAEFGSEVIGDSGQLDRAAMRRLVFADAARRKTLERILHPRIRERTLAAIDTLQAPYALVVVPLLFETGFHELVDRSVVVDCPVETQLERLKHRDDVDERTAQGMLAAQLDRKARVARGDDVIDNGGDRAATRAQVEALHRRYLQLANDRLPK